MIVQVMKEFEALGQENVQQVDIINRMVQKLEIDNIQVSTNIEKGIESSKKVSIIIQRLIQKENILLIT